MSRFKRALISVLALVTALLVTNVNACTPAYAGTDVITCGDVIYVDPSTGLSGSHMRKNTAGDIVFCVQHGVTTPESANTPGATTEVTTSDLLGLTSLFQTAYGEAKESFTWEQWHITDAALIQQFFQSKGLSETETTILIQGYLWNYIAAQGNLEQIGSTSEEFPANLAAYRTELIEYINANRARYKGTGVMYDLGTSPYSGNHYQWMAVFSIELQVGNISLQKTSGNKALSDNNSCYSLEGAVYSVYSDQACSNVVGTLVTNNEGKAQLNELTVGTYYVKETTAARGYALDSKVYSIEVSAGQTTTVNGGSVVDLPQNNPIGAIVQKVDLETGLASPLSKASLEGAEFTVRYYNGYYSKTSDLPANATRTWVFKTDESGHANFTQDYLVSGDAFYTSSDGSLVLPLGTVSIQETKAPLGYLLSDNTVYLQQITSAGTSETVNTFVEPSVDSPTVKEQVKRGDFEFSKTDGITMEPLAGIPFLITSQATGEAHIAVTDDNGELKTQSTWNAHTDNTNSNDKALGEDGTLDETALDSAAGLWFSGSKDVSSPADDAKGALPYDVYTVEELACSANKGRVLVSFDVTISRNNTVVDRGTIDDNPEEEPAEPRINTTASDAADGDEALDAALESVTINDVVIYENLEPGTTYIVQGVLMDKSTGTELCSAEGTPITASAEFVAEDISGEVTVSFTFDPRDMDSNAIAVFEELYFDTELIAEHKDINDKDQTVELVRKPEESPTEEPEPETPTPEEPTPTTPTVIEKPKEKLVKTGLENTLPLALVVGLGGVAAFGVALYFALSKRRASYGSYPSYLRRGHRRR